jgi:hypothetical protein
MENPNDTLRLSDAEVRLFPGARRIADGETAIVCDRMVVLVGEVMGNEDDVVVYKRNGKRRVGQLRMLVAFESGPIPNSVSTDFNEAVQEISPGEERRLLAVYDKFATRTWLQ